MKYLIDTDVIIDYLRAKLKLRKQLLEGGAGISIITLGELIYGAHKSTNPQKSINIALSFIKESELEIIDLSQETIYHFGWIKAGLEKSGKRLEDFDLLIAATARVNGFILVTGNKKHFERIPDLKLD